MRRIVQVREEERDVFIIRQVPDGTVVLAPLQAHLPPGFNALLDRIVLVSRAEHLTHIVGQSLLVSVATPCQHIALEMRRVTLEGGPGELLADDLVQPGKAVGNHQADVLNAAFQQVIEHIGPFYRIVVEAQHLTRGVFVHAQDHVERLRGRPLLAEHLDVHTVDKHDRIILVQPSLQPLILHQMTST